jgi:Ceramidase
MNNCNLYQKYFEANKAGVGGIQADFAENNICGSYIEQPANAISSIAYNIIGFYLLSIKGDQKIRNIFFVLFQLIGLGSFVLHSTSTYIGQLMDFIPIFLIINYFIYLSMDGVYKYLIPISNLITGMIFLIFAPQYRIVLLALQLLNLLTHESNIIVKQKIKSNNWKNGWLIFLASFGFWLLDEYRIWDLDLIEHFFNAHVIWHIGTAFALYYIAKYYLQKKETLI